MKDDLKDKGWARLDNVGNLFPSVASDRITGYFRISCVLLQPVRKGVLQEAVENVMPRFPYYNVEIIPNLFWHTFIPSKHPLLVIPDSPNPNLPLGKHYRGRHPFRVRIFETRLSVEFHHSLTDGTGALTFLRSLLAEYFRLLGVVCEDYGDIFLPHQTPEKGEREDSYKFPYDPDIPLIPRKEHSFKHPGKFVPKDRYLITQGYLPLDLTLARAKERGVSLTEFLISVLFMAWQDLFFQIKKFKHRKLGPIRLTIPVNLRKLYKSNTMLNFFLTIPLELDPRLGEYTFEEVLEKVHHFMQIEVNSKSILPQINGNLRGEKYAILRMMPLWIKNIFLGYMYRSGEKEVTSSLSNLGNVRLPVEIADKIERFEFIPPPSEGARIAASVVSFKNVLSISFGRIAQGSWIEALFFHRLRKLALPVKIETNHSIVSEEP